MQNLCGKTKGQIMEALEIISKICLNNSCSECPFYHKNGFGNNECVINEITPNDWKINVKDEHWRALE